ncbi:MAG: hypothetical protein IPK16_11195 [Anaerolineales bacterium]|nr:hypothetical protein [Anaerolineales bacterium]
MKSCVHMHAYSLVPAQRQRIQLVYTGFLLDVLSTTDLPAEYYGSFDDDSGVALLRRSLQTVFRDIPATEMYTEEFLGSMRQEFDDEFRALALEVKDPLFPNWHSNFELRHSESRFTQLGNELLRGALICRTPFSDRDLVEACLAVPVGMRQGRQWLRRIVVRYAPKLAKVPWDRTGLPLEETLRSVTIRIDHQSRWYLRNLGAKWVAPPKRKSYQNYAQWLRVEMQPWVESVLLSPNALARGILNPQYQQRLVEDHMHGADYARELGVLLAIELWHRAYID